MAATSFLAETDLHGLVDGRIEPERRTEALRQLAGSPADRTLVEAWQGHNELLKGVFGNVAREPLPALLDLNAKPRLVCIPANEAPLLGPAGGKRLPPERSRLGLVTMAVALIACGIGAAWFMQDTANVEDTLAGAKLRGTVDAAIASRSTDAVAGPATPRAAHPGGENLPTTDIPDLQAAGFAFTGADADTAAPASILFRYQNDKADRIVVSVARAAPQDSSPTPIARIGNAYSWHKRDKAYAIAGTVRPARLRSIAISLLSADPTD